LRRTRNGAPAASSQAGIIFTPGNNPTGNEENVNLTNGNTGMSVFGLTNTTNVPVEFTSTQTLLTSTSGQANIQAVSGGSQVGMTNIAISAPNHTYNDLIFNTPINMGIGQGGGTLEVFATDTTGVVFPFITTLGNGSNFLTLTTTGGEQILSTSMVYTNPNGFTNLSQVRISGVEVIPEPASIVMMLTGLSVVVVLGVLWRRRAVAAVT
jgi:hypothetical protein